MSKSKDQQLVAELRRITKNKKFKNEDLLSWAGKAEQLKYKEGEAIVRLPRFGVWCVISAEASHNTDTENKSNGSLRELLLATCPVCEKKIKINKDTHCGVGCDCVNNTTKLLNKLKEVISQRNRAIMENSYLHAKVEAWEVWHKDIKKKIDKLENALQSIQEKTNDFNWCIDNIINDALGKEQ
jgi:hypothetical protein